MGWSAILDTVDFPDGAREVLEARMDHYKLAPYERELVAELIAGRSTKEAYTDLGITKATFFQVQTGIAKKTNLVGKDRLVVILHLLGVVS